MTTNDPSEDFERPPPRRPGRFGSQDPDAFAKERPDLNKDHGVLLEPLHDGLISADLRLTAKLLLGVVAFVLLTCCAFPAWQAARLPPLQALQAMTSGGRTSTGGGSTFRNVLAMSQVAAAVVMLCGAGLLLRSLVALASVDPGHRASDVLTMTIGLPFVRPNAPPGTPYATIDARRQFFDAVEREVSSVPGVRSVTWGSALPLDGWWIGYTFQRDGDPPRPEAQRDLSHYKHVGTAYFETLGILIVSGRAFTSLDTEHSPPVCIVNEALVRRYFGNQTPLGARLIVRGSATRGGPLPVREIVGVVGQVRERPDEADMQPQIYVPFRQDPPTTLTLVVQPLGGAASALTPAVRAAVARLDKERPVGNVQTIAAISYKANAAARFRAS